jgi:predicted RNase H-like nuclease (RuvC/YqgF family)
MTEEDELYGDLEQAAQTAEAQLLQDHLKKCIKKNESLTAEIGECKSQLAAVLSEKDQVEKNMVILFNTAQREIERKDREIAGLKREVESMRRSNSK